MARLAMLLLLLPSLALAAGLELTAERTTGALNQPLTVKLTITGRPETGVTLQPPTALRLREVFRAESEGMRRGRVTRQTVLTYAVAADAEGTYTLGPARATIDGQSLRSNTLTLHFGAAKALPRTSARAATPEPTAPSGEIGAVVRLSDDQPYVGEPFVWELEIRVPSSIRTRGLSWSSKPGFDGLNAEFGVPEAETEDVQLIDGVRTKLNYVRVPLFGTEAGTFPIEAPELSAEVLSRRRGGFGLAFTNEVPFQGTKSVVTVRPLPDGKPDAYSGAVGRFRVAASLDSNEIAAGETAMLEIAISGRGALRGIELPVTLDPAIRVYDEQPDARAVLTEGGLQSQAIWRKALVPLEPGRYTIPPIEFHYFDPTAERYRVGRSSAMALTVTGTAVPAPDATASSEFTAAKEQVEVLGSDILPLHTGTRVLGDARVRPTSPLVLALLGLPLLGFLAVAGQRTRSHLDSSDAGRRRKRDAAAKLASAAARKAARAGDLDAADTALRTVLDARLNRSGAALTAAEAEAAVVEAGGSASLGQRLARVLSGIEGARYGGESTTAAADAIAAWIDEAEEGL